MVAAALDPVEAGPRRYPVRLAGPDAWHAAAGRCHRCGRRSDRTLAEPLLSVTLIDEGASASRRGRPIRPRWRASRCTTRVGRRTTWPRESEWRCASTRRMSSSSPDRADRSAPPPRAGRDGGLPRSSHSRRSRGYAVGTRPVDPVAATVTPTRWPAWSLDLPSTLGPLVHGRGDRTMRLGASEAWLTFRTRTGPATLHLVLEGDRLAAETWGMARPRHCRRPRARGRGGRPRQAGGAAPVVADLQRRHPGLRIRPRAASSRRWCPPSSSRRSPASRPAASYAGAGCAAYGEPAPGPAAARPRRAARARPPSPASPYYAFHRFGVERKRADTIRRAWHRRRRGSRRRSACPATTAYRRLGRSPGSGRGPRPRWRSSPSATPTR